MGQGIGRRGFPQMGQRQFGNPATDRLRNPKPMGQPFAGPKPGGSVGSGMGGMGMGGGLQGYNPGQSAGLDQTAINANPGGFANYLAGGGQNPFGQRPGMGGLLPQQGGNVPSAQYNGQTIYGPQAYIMNQGGTQASGGTGTQFGGFGGGGGDISGLLGRGRQAMSGFTGAGWEPQGGGMGSQFGGFGGAAGGFGGYGAPAGGGMQGGSVTGPGGGIPGLPGYDPNANVNAIGGNNAPSAGGAGLGPGDQNPNGRFDGMSGSDIFARLFGQRP